MSDINSCTFTGRLARDPELRATEDGTQVLSLGIVCNMECGDDPEQHDEGEDNIYLEFEVFGPRAEALSKFLCKGALVSVREHARYSEWDAKDGSRRFKVEFVVDEVVPLRAALAE